MDDEEEGEGEGEGKGEEGERESGEMEEEKGERGEGEEGEEGSREGEEGKVGMAGRSHTKRKRVGVKQRKLKTKKRLGRVVPGSEVTNDWCGETAVSSGEPKSQKGGARHRRKMKHHQEGEGEPVKRRRIERDGAIKENGLHGVKSSPKKRVSFSLHKNTIFTP